MAILVKNVNFSISLSLTMLRLVGFWPPENLSWDKKIVYNCYGMLSLMFLLGSYLIFQSVGMWLIWGDLPLMTGIAFVMFTNVAQLVKIVNLVGRRALISSIIASADEVLRSAEGVEAKAIVKRCNRDTLLLCVIYCCLTFVTMLGWATSPEKGQLPLRAWYPYDETQSPAYELSYCHQIGALFVMAFVNMSKDMLVTALIAQCRCSLQLLVLRLKTLGQGLHITEKSHLTLEQELVVKSRLRSCVEHHLRALEAAQQLQYCFSEHIFVQFMISLIIICVSAFQLVSVTNPVRMMAMTTYLLAMMYQVFLYCYQANQLSEESSEIAGAVYQCPWYKMSKPLQRSLLIVMTRSQRLTKITAGGFITLSLASFMGIIKMSYSMFTLLRQLDM
ncbi:hypothetical protein ACJJTC_010616 [Scirpophaga incertulas]